MSWAYTTNLLTQSNEASQSITAIADGGSNELDLTVTAHGYVAGDLLQVTGTTSYNGCYIVSSVIDADTVAIPDVTVDGNTQNLFVATETGSVARGDDDLSGLTGLTDVTTTTTGDGGSIITVHEVAATCQIVVSGAVRHDPDAEKLIFAHKATNSARSFVVESTGIYNYGVRRTGNSQIAYSRGQGIVGTGENSSSSGADSIYINGDGTFNWNGGVIALGGIFCVGNGGYINQYAGTFINTHSSSQNQFRFESNNPTNDARINVYDLVLTGTGSPAILLTNASWNNMVVKYENAGMRIPAGGGSANTLLNPRATTNIFEFDVEFNVNDEVGVQEVTILNPDRPFNIVSAGSSKNGLATERRTAQVNLKTITRADANATKYYAIDNNDNGGREAVNGIDYTSDNVYSGTSSSGLVSLGNVMIRLATAIESATVTSENRFSNAVMPVYLCGYEYLFSTVELPLYGNGTLSPEWVELPDSSITEATKAAVDAYTDLDNARQFYDRAKAYRFDNFAGETSPIVLRTGTLIEAGFSDVTIDATAGSAFAYSEPSTAGIGTISSTGTTVTGVGTSFTTELKVGMKITANSRERRIVTIDSDTSLTIQQALSTDWAAQSFTFKTPLIVVKSSAYTGGFKTTGELSQLNGATITDLVLEGATWNAVQATWTGSADADTTIDVASTGTYDATGFTFDASSTLNNSSGGAINIVISSGQQQPTVTGGGTTTFLNAGATITFNNLTSANVQIIESDTTTVNQRYTAQTGTLVFNTPDGSSGTWKYVVDREGYDPIIGSFTADGDNVSVDATLTQKRLADGTAMYVNGYPNSAFLSVVPNADGSRMNLRIGDGAVNAQAILNEVEDALLTQDGMSYLSNGGGQVAIALLPTGTFVFMGSNVRVIRDTAPDANATINAFVQSTDGTVLDATNGAVQFVTPNSDVNIVSVNSVNVTNIDDFKATTASLDNLGVNIQQVNGYDVDGEGTETSPWGPI